MCALAETVSGRQRRASPKLRMTEIEDKGHAVLNRIDEYSNWTFGELALFNPGQRVPVLIDNDEVAVLDLKELSLQSGQHLIKGVIYYIVCQRHVVFIQPPNISVATLRSYLEWLLCNNGPRIAAPLRLEAMIEVKGEKAPKVHAIGFKAKSNLVGNEEGKMRSETVKEVTAAGSVRSSSTSTAINMARAAGMSSADLQLLTSLADGGELIAEMRLKLIKEGKTVKFDKVRVSDLLTDQESDTMSFYGENGKFKGDLSRLRYTGAQVQTVGDFLAPDDSRRALVEAYNFFRANGHIDAPQLEMR